MVNQYAFLNGLGVAGETTYYNYWNHGKDGLLWDCISLVGLATGRVILEEDSPVWLCEVNGAKHFASEMDYAYVDMMKNWLAGNVSDVPYIRAAHKKVAALLEVAG